MERHHTVRGVLILPLLLCLLVRVGAAQPPPSTPPQQGPPLSSLVLEGASVYSHDDALWLLDLHEGAPLPSSPESVAAALKERYDRDGYTEAQVTPSYDNGVLTLRVDEGRIDDVEVTGLTARGTRRARETLEIRPGDIFNKRTVGQAVERLVKISGGALSTADEVTIEHRNGRRVVIVPLRGNDAHTSFTSGTERREDFYTPVDAFAPSVGFATTIFDHRQFNHTLIDGTVSYKFGRDDAGYSLGIERPIFRGPRLYFGAEMHDMSASDDLWRLSTLEQSLVALGFKNSFRDYYRRRGQQIFSVFEMGGHNELGAIVRWDRHEPLPNDTDFSFFGDEDKQFRPNPLVKDQHVNSLVLRYMLDTREVTGAGDVTTYERHLADNLFGFGWRQQPGLRLEWTSEIAGHGLGGDAEFDRHIFNLRGYLAFTRRQLWSSRAIIGTSGGELPLERRFAIGGIGSVHGYAFKEAVGDGMVLFNTEYRVDLTPNPRGSALFSVHGFYDLGKVTGPFNGSRSDWLQGIGVGFTLSGIRVDFGFRADDIPNSRQILVRLGPTF